MQIVPPEIPIEELKKRSDYPKIQACMFVIGCILLGATVYLLESETAVPSIGLELHYLTGAGAAIAYLTALALTKPSAFRDCTGIIIR